jgi:TonB family protein
MHKSLFGGAMALLLAIAPAAQAQTSAPTLYDGPRYPGGPDSLRALVYRSTRLLAPSQAGRVVLQFELKDGQQPGNFKLVGPDRRAKSDLGKAAQAAQEYLQAQMPAWQPAPPKATDKPGRNPRIMLALNFAAVASAQPYPYADQEPTFAYLPSGSRSPNAPEGAAIPAQMAASYSGLAEYVQRQVRYPADALRNREQGRVNVYFEIAENGTVENPEVIGSAGNHLDDEVLRTVRSLRPAATPGLLNGRPVRVFYVMPITFKMI